MSRNHINALASDAIIALPGGAGTASEASLVLRCRKPITAYLGEDGEILGLHPSIPIAQEIRDVEQFLVDRLASLRTRSG